MLAVQLSPNLNENNLQQIDMNSATDANRVCTAMNGMGMFWRDSHINLVRELLVKERLGNQRTTGECRGRGRRVC